MRVRSGTLCHSICINWGVARGIYLVSGSLLLCGFIVEMILIGLVVAPYIRDADFAQATCSFLSSRYTGYVDCQDVTRRPNSLPCLEVLVSFAANGSSRTLPVAKGVATMFTVLSYYEDSTSSGQQCSSRICYRDNTMNLRQIANLNVTLYNGNSSYPCFVRQATSGGKFVALRTHEIEEPKVFHCLLWPCLAFGVGSFLLWSTYCCFGCKVWPKGVSL